MTSSGPSQSGSRWPTDIARLFWRPLKAADGAEQMTSSACRLHYEGIRVCVARVLVVQIKRALAPVFADCMVSSLSFDGAFWLLDFGAGKPFWFWGGIFPLAPWGFALVQEPPNLPLAASSPLPLQPAAAAGGGGGGFLIFSAVPSRHANKMRALAESVLKDFLRNDSDDQDRNLQQGD